MKKLDAKAVGAFVCAAFERRAASRANRALLNMMLVVLVGLSLSACNTTKRAIMPVTSNLEAEALTLPASRQATFALRKVVANIKRGTEIANFPPPGTLSEFDGALCNNRHEGESYLYWASGSSVLGNWSTELGELFHNVMSGKGFNVAGDPSDLFQQGKKAGSAEYQVGARIIDVKGNLCQAHHGYYGYPTENYSGEFYVKVEWSVYSNLERKKLFAFETDGYFSQKKSKSRSVINIFHGAFETSIEGVAANQKFIDLALRKDNANEEEKIIAFDTSIEIDDVAPRTKKLERDINRILPAVVTVRVGSGHGSGFAVSRDGHILTNAHVVGTSKFATIRLNNGLEIKAEVLRRNKQRDVALIKAPLRFPVALALREKPVKRLQKVIVIGSPASEDLQSTITTGVVSALRKEGVLQLPIIQSDVAVSGGNSGGPMLDELGNLVGISVAGIMSAGGGPKGLNLFIPIHDAFRSLNLVVSKKSPGS